MLGHTLKFWVVVGLAIIATIIYFRRECKFYANQRHKDAPHKDPKDTDDIDF